MFQIARNEAAKLAKCGNQRSEQSLTAEQTLELVDRATDSADDVQIIVAALARLSAENRELVHLKIYIRLTFREIAELTLDPQVTVATRYRRAIESLRPWLLR